MKKPSPNFILLIIFFIAFLLRIYHLSTMPLFGDEIDVGLQANSLGTNLRDYRGNFLPSYLSSFAEARAPLLMYLSIPSVKLLGLNPLGVRLTPIIFGMLSIFFFYRLILLLSKNQTLSLAAAAVLATSPWHIHYSRHAFEVTLLLFLLQAGTFYFYRFIDSKKTKDNFLFIFLFALSFYTYNTANIFVPLLSLFLFFLHFNFFKKLHFTFYLKNILLIGILTLPLLIELFSGQASNRFNLISIFNQPETIDQIIFKRTGFSSTNQPSERLFHNKLTAYSNNFFDNYLSSFNPNFLFANGDPLPRHNLPGFGLLLIVLAPFLLIGIIKTPKDKTFNLFLFWLITAPIPAALTQDGGTHATRLFIMLPPLVYFISSGLFQLENKIVFQILLFIVFLPSFGLYLHEYYIHYPREQFEYFQYGNSRLFQSLPQNYNRLFISNQYYNSLPAYLFYQSIDPKIIQSKTNPDMEVVIPETQLSGFTLNDKVIFVNSWNNPDILAKIKTIADPGDIFLLFQGKDIPGDLDFRKEPLSGFNTIAVINNPNNTIYGQIIQKQ